MLGYASIIFKSKNQQTFVIDRYLIYYKECANLNATGEAKINKMCDLPLIFLRTLREIIPAEYEQFQLRRDN